MLMTVKKHTKKQTALLSNANSCGVGNSWVAQHLLYWAIQAGLLTPLTFAQHCLSPLAAFTAGAYFLHNGRR